MPINRGHCGCRFCPDSFGSWEAVNSHERAKHTVFCSGYDCSECGREFATEAGMYQHYNAKHCFECPECDDEFTTESARDQHYNAAHRWVDCPACDSTFSTREGMNQHYNVKHRFECPECDREFTTRTAMDQHYEANHRTFGCPECDREFRTEAAKDQHYDAKHRFKCPKCNDEFTTQAALNWHYNAEHRLIKCIECYCEFKTEAVMEQHRIAKHRYHCAHCSDFFVTEWERSRHYETKHSFPCPKCAEKFTTTALLQIHVKNEHKTYPCPKCSAKFDEEAGLKKHVGSEHKPPPPPCNPPSNQPSRAKGGEPSRSKADDTKSPPNLVTEALAQTVTKPNQDQETTLSSRFYCQEEDCGRGFSTQGFLDTHTKFFHPKKRNEPSLGTPMLSGSNTLGGRVNDREVKLPMERASDMSLTQRKADEKNTSADIATQFRCRICDKSPSVLTQPTATFCGHLFCYKCIMPKVTSASKCPVCHDTLSASQIFRLDISC